jgi:asparagine synthase (glutamine-hydrolysing)
MMGGYDIFKEAKVRRFWAAQPESRLRPLLLRRLYPYLPNLQMLSPEYLQAFFHVQREDAANAFFSHLPRWELTSRLKKFLSEETKSRLTAPDSLGELEAELPESYRTWPTFCQAQYLESRYLLPGYVLSSQGDRMAMASGVETRFPFLDSQVVKLASQIPPQLKMKVLNEKYLLKRCAGGLVPPSVSSRHKQPYRAPDGDSFFRNGEPIEYVDILLSPDEIRKSGLFQPAAVQSLVSKFRRKQAIGFKDNMAFIGILSTQLLIHQFIDRLELYSERASSPIHYQ